MDYRVEKIPFFVSYYEAYKVLDSDEDKLRFIDAILSYAFTGKITPLEGNLNALFLLAKPNIDKSIENSLKGKLNGKHGGAPKGNQNACKKCIPETTPRLFLNKTEEDKEEEYGEGQTNTPDYTEGVIGSQAINYRKLYQ